MRDDVEGVLQRTRRRNVGEGEGPRFKAIFASRARHHSRSVKASLVGIRTRGCDGRRRISPGQHVNELSPSTGPPRE